MTFIYFLFQFGQKQVLIWIFEKEMNYYLPLIVNSLFKQNMKY